MSAVRLLIFGLIVTCLGCGPKKVVGTFVPSKPGGVTYSNAGDGPIWMANGSAKFSKTVPIKQSFERLPHHTYVVFRDTSRGEDHVIAVAGAGDLTVTQDSVAVRDEACLYRVVPVQPVQTPVTVSVTPKPVELLDLSATAEEPRIIITSDGNTRLKFPSMWHLDDVFGLDEVREIKLTKNFTGSGTITFVLAEAEHEVPFSAAATATQHYDQLSRVVKPMTPHVKFSADRSWLSRNWWWALGLLLLIGLGAIGAAKSK